MKKGDRIGIVGRNGAGKTTLMRTILGELAPDAGTVVLGQNTRPAYLEQSRRDLVADNTVVEEVADGYDHVELEDGRVHVKSFLKTMGFPPTVVDSKVGQLSGGERNRVQLAKLLRRGGNVLVLDEPTNRSRSRDARRARARAARVPRVRVDRVARSVVSRPRRDWHPRVRRAAQRREQRDVLRGQLHELPGQTPPLSDDLPPARRPGVSYRPVAIDPELEKTIAAHLSAGDHAQAATVALGALGPQILGYIHAMIRDEDAAHDVFGRFSEELWKSMGTFRAESSFKTWAYKLVMHSIGRHRRDPYLRRGQAMASGELSAIVQDVRSRTAPFQRTEVKDKISRLRASLDPEDQSLLFLRIDQGLSWTEVAEVMSAEAGDPVDAATLRKRFERAKQRLRKMADEEGLLR